MANTGGSEKDKKKNVLVFDREKAAKAADSTSSKKIQNLINEALEEENEAKEDNKTTRIFDASSLKEEMKTSTHDLDAFDLSFSANENEQNDKSKGAPSDLTESLLSSKVIEKTESEIITKNQTRLEENTSSEELSLKLEELDESDEENKGNEDESKTGKDQNSPSLKLLESSLEIPATLEMDFELERSSKGEKIEKNSNVSEPIEIDEKEEKQEEKKETLEKDNKSFEPTDKLGDLNDLFDKEQTEEKKEVKGAALELDMLDISQVSKNLVPEAIQELSEKPSFPSDSEVLPQQVEEEVTELLATEELILPNDNKTKQNTSYNSSPPRPPLESSSQINKLKELKEQGQEISLHYNEELIRLQATIRNLRIERKTLLEEIEKLEGKSLKLNQENLGLIAENDELKIELDILLKRKNEEIESVRYQQKIAEERRDIAEAKAKKIKEELSLNSRQVRVDVNKIREREKELESQLELLKSDLAIQISSRDKKIMELKRHIDILEFDKEGLEQKEKQFSNEKRYLEEKIEKIMKALKTTMGMLDSDQSFEEKTSSMKKLKL